MSEEKCKLCDGYKYLDYASFCMDVCPCQKEETVKSESTETPEQQKTAPETASELVAGIVGTRDEIFDNAWFIKSLKNHGWSDTGDAQHEGAINLWGKIHHALEAEHLVFQKKAYKAGYDQGIKDAPMPPPCVHCNNVGHLYNPDDTDGICGRCGHVRPDRSGEVVIYGDPLLPELITELNAPSRERLIEAVRFLCNCQCEECVGEHADTIKYCMENRK